MNDPSPVLEVDGLVKHFVGRRPLPIGNRTVVRAVDGVSFTIKAGEAFGLVGESGCGKSTVGRAITRLIEPDAGIVRLAGEAMSDAQPAQLKQLRQRIQMIFQDPYASLNPKRSVGATLAEPLRVHQKADRAAVSDQVARMLAAVGLPEEAANRYPHEFSGGQRQRIGIARALMLNPNVIIADEAVSALDVSIQAQILALLKKLQVDRGVAYLFISHDLGVVRYVCQRMAVMYLGRIIETGPIPEIFDHPLHPYTEMLRDASPVPDPARKVTMARITGEVASAAAPPQGCHFHTRCPHATDHCRRVYPPWIDKGNGRGVACHLYDNGT